MNIKSDKKVAVLDLGTNVFNLLLAELSNESCRYLKEYKYPSLIGAGGLSQGMISDQAFFTADKAFSQIMSVIRQEGGADVIVPYATSAIRDASNCSEFVEFFNSKYGFKIDVISGDKEAEFVFKGIILSLKNIDIKKNMLFLDIGGGSNEFIITDGKHSLWKRSFPIGMARMREKFNYSEPISLQAKQDFCNFCEKVLDELWLQADIYKPQVLVGSSGSFDTFKDLIFNCEYCDMPSIELPYKKFIDLNEILTTSTMEERLKMRGMSQIRVDYIVLASIFVRMIMEKLKINKIYQSSYSLKEGAMQELYESLQLKK